MTNSVEQDVSNYWPIRNINRPTGCLQAELIGQKPYKKVAVDMKEELTAIQT